LRGACGTVKSTFLGAHACAEYDGRPTPISNFREVVLPQAVREGWSTRSTGSVTHRLQPAQIGVLFDAATRTACVKLHADQYTDTRPAPSSRAIAACRPITSNTCRGDGARDGRAGTVAGLIPAPMDPARDRAAVDSVPALRRADGGRHQQQSELVAVLLADHDDEHGDASVPHHAGGALAGFTRVGAQALGMRDHGTLAWASGRSRGLDVAHPMETRLPHRRHAVPAVIKEGRVIFEATPRASRAV